MRWARTVTKILALDLSEASTGVAIGDGAGPPHSYSITLNAKNDLGRAGAALYTALRSVIVTNRPDMIAIEAPLLAMSRPTSARGIRMLTGLAFLAHTVAAQSRIKSVEVAVSTWRKMFLGHGRPENPKKAALVMCDRLGWDHGGVHDRAEACGIWAWAQFEHGDRRAIMRLLSDSSVKAMAEGSNGRPDHGRRTRGDR